MKPARFGMVATVFYAVFGLSGCQMQSAKPTASIEISGNYKAIADCFFLKVRGEGMWDKDDFDSMNASHVTMGTERFEAGRIEFVGLSPATTQARLLIAHPAKFIPMIKSCSAPS